MDAKARELIAALHATPFRCVLALTGGGAGAAGMLLTVPGGSRTVLEVRVPYAAQALDAFLGRRPEQYCSADTSRALAGRALQRARWLTPAGPILGLGCTASLATDRPKHGDHRFHISVESDAEQVTYSLILNKGARGREDEEGVLDAVLLNALAAAAGIPDRIPTGLLSSETLELVRDAGTTLWHRFVAGDLTVLHVLPDGRLSAMPPAAPLVLSGAFNPLHEGHRNLVRAAAQVTGLTAAYELSVVNADKPALAADEVRRRTQQFAWDATLLLTRAPTFGEKARLFPGARFVVGADTAARIVQRRFYQDSDERMRAALEEVRARGCRFLVADRVQADRLMSLADLEVPAEFRDLFVAIPPAHFRSDVSSTEIRTRARAL